MFKVFTKASQKHQRVAYKSFKTKEEISWKFPKVVAVVYQRGRLEELLIAKFARQFKREIVIEDRSLSKHQYL